MEIGHLDYICSAFSILGILLWWLTKVGDIAILFSILADGLAAVPTVIKSFRTPESESYGVYLSSLISGMITLLTITVWNFATWGFPVYLTLIGFLLFILIKFPIKKHV